MKVVSISTKDSFGGAARVAYRLHEEVNREGIDNILLVNAKRTDSTTVRLASDFHNPLNFLTYRLRKFEIWYQERLRRINWAKYPNKHDKILSDIAVSLLQNSLDKLDYDLIHMHWVGESFVDFTELSNVKNPIIWTIHDCFSFTALCSYFETCEKYKTHCEACPQLASDKKKDLSYEVFEMKQKRYSNLNFHIVSPSRWLGERAKESALLKDFPVTIIPNGIDTQVFSPIDKSDAKQKLGLDPSKKTILFGGISALADPRKGGLLLADSLNQLSKRYTSDDIQLLVFGSEQKSGYQFDFPIKYLGYVDKEEDLMIAYNAADVTVVPSKYENFPNTILESISCGTPVVGFNIGGNPDMIDHEENGYLACPYDVDDLTAGLIFCIENNRENILGKNARKKVLSNFKIEDIAKQYIRLYNDILNQ